MDQKKKEKFRIRHKRTFVSLVAVIIALIVISSVLFVGFVYVPPYTLHNSSSEFTFATNNSEFNGTGPWVGNYYVNGNITSITYLNQSKPSAFKMSLGQMQLNLRQNTAFEMNTLVLTKPGDLFYCFISGLSVKGHILDNLHPTGVELHFYLIGNNKGENYVHIINQNNTYGCIWDRFSQSVDNLSTPEHGYYPSYPYGPSIHNFSSPVVLGLSTKNVTHFDFFSSGYYNFGLTMLVRLTFNATRNLSSVQGQNFELCASLLGLGKKVTSSVEVNIRVLPLVYITKNMGVPFFYMKNDRTNVTYIVNETNRSLPVEPYTNYTAFFYLNGTKESYTFNTGPPFVDRVLNVDPEKPYFGFLYNP
ncbi:MAG: hypothetical protein LVQ96_02625 [Thermoplasmatales archaeon]|nr:hypothetical protein [Thermoplasmatales archaeon]MCW6170046.1 hypothetical protein [Thermoplasmatales archaeon]